MIHEEQESESPLQSTRTVWLMPEDASNGGHLEYSLVQNTHCI